MSVYGHKCFQHFGIVIQGFVIYIGYTIVRGIYITNASIFFFDIFFEFRNQINAVFCIYLYALKLHLKSDWVLK